MTMTIGVDVGTEGTKVIAVRDNGAVVASAYEAYVYKTPYPGWVEQPPSDWWYAVVRCFGQLWGQGMRPEEVTAIGVTGQMHSPVMLDDNMQVVRSSVLWNDTRATELCHELDERLSTYGDEFRFNNILPGFTVASLLWIKRFEPEVAARIRYVMLPKDYINFCLTGARCTDSTDASGTGVFDFEARNWHTRLMEVLDIPVEWFSPLVPSHHVIGRVHASASEETGLTAGTPVIAGAGDNPVSGVGVSLHELGRGFVTIGTSGAIVTSQRELPWQRSQASEEPSLPLHVTSNPLSDYWLVAASSLSAGACLRWLRDAFGIEEDYTNMMEQAKQVQPGSDGLMFIPHLTGTRSTTDAHPKNGAFLGLQLFHRMPHFVRAVVEGVSFSLRDCLVVMERELGVSFSELTFTGGAANSDVWAQILADVLDCTIYTSTHFQGAAFGVAVLAGIGVCGWDHSTLQTHVRGRKFDPSVQKERYREAYQRYRDLSGLL